VVDADPRENIAVLGDPLTHLRVVIADGNSSATGGHGPVGWAMLFIRRRLIQIADGWNARNTC
jgi:hypothetical protein